MDVFKDEDRACAAELGREHSHHHVDRLQHPRLPRELLGRLVVLDVDRKHLSEQRRHPAKGLVVEELLVRLRADRVAAAGGEIVREHRLESVA